MSFIAYDFTNFMNSKNLSLTNREKNLPVTFLIYKSGMRVFQMLATGHFGKMVIKIKNSEHKPLVKLVENLKNYKNFFLYLMFNNKFNNIDPFSVRNLEKILNNKKSI